MAQWLAYALPYRRFVDVLANGNARLGADVVRYAFIVSDFHVPPPPPIIHNLQHNQSSSPHPSPPPHSLWIGDVVKYRRQEIEF